MTRSSLAPLVVLSVALAPAEVRAAKAGVEAKVDRPIVGLGEIVEYSVVLRAARAIAVDEVSPGKHVGFDVLTTQTSLNGLIKPPALTVTFRLRAKKLGQHVLGPARFVTDDGVVTAPTVKVEVVAAGTAPAKPLTKPAPFDPLDDLFFKDPHQDEEEPPPPPLPPSDPLAKIDELPTSPKERDFFVRVAVADPKPVVGSQVTAKLFVYARGNPNVFVKKPPVFTDFRTVPLGQVDKQWKPIRIAGESWRYAALEAYAVFPLRTGKLTIGPAEVQTTTPAMFGNAIEREHETPSLEIEAVEPKPEGRPSGYVLGDVVSNLELAADVTPRVVTDGHALVTLRMKGAGRLDPLRPILPTPPGVTWTTTGDDTKTRVESLVVHGARKLVLDARLEKHGEVDLGDAVLHVWDPVRASYVTVKASLGKVRVDVSAANAATGSSPAAALPPPRLGTGARGEGSTFADRTFVWALSFAAPLVVVGAQGASLALRRRRERSAGKIASPLEQARAALEEAKSADAKNDRGACLAALSRALDRALEHTTKVRARGLTKSELSRALEATALPSKLRDEVVSTFAALENARFAGDAPPRVAVVADLVDRLLGAAT